MNATSIIASLLTTANTTVTLNNGLIMPTMLWGSGGEKCVKCEHEHTHTQKRNCFSIFSKENLEKLRKLNLIFVKILVESVQTVALYLVIEASL